MLFDYYLPVFDILLQVVSPWLYEKPCDFPFIIHYDSDLHLIRIAEQSFFLRNAMNPATRLQYQAFFSQRD